jgi:predicted negative regulator of RcsB-dependent stress response
LIRLISAILPFALAFPFQAASPPQVAAHPIPPSAAHSLENEFSISLTMFSTLAAINAAGYDAGLDSPLNEHFKVRIQVREELAKRQLACLPELKEFYRQHRKASDTANLSQYLSFALIVHDAPSFELPAEVPPDVEPLRNFSSLLARFYKEADLANLWQRAQPAYSAAITQYQDAVINTIFEANGYLRNPSGYLGRRFQIYLDLMAAPNQVQVRSYKDDFYIVITPTSVPAVDEIRDAYLAYILDPLSFKYSSVIKQKNGLARYAQEAPALDLAYKDDFSLLVTKCLIKAIGTRLTHESPEKRSAAVNQAMREGFILTAGLYDLLPAYEKQPDSFRLYYPELLSAVDVHKEEKRLKNVQFAQSVQPRVVAPPAKMQIDPAEESLDAAEGMFEQHDNENAEKSFRKVLQQTSNKPLQGRAYYGLGLIALQQKRWDEALNLFQRTIDASPDSSAAGWSHYYLGQLQLKAGDASQATSQFQMALNTAGISAKAREAVEKAMQSISSGEKQQ